MNESGNVSPFYDTTCITIASLALKIYRLNFLRKKCIGIIPAGGYRGKVNQSLIALIWLDEINVEIGGGLEYKCSRNGETLIILFINFTDVFTTAVQIVFTLTIIILLLMKNIVIFIHAQRSLHIV